MSDENRNMNLINQTNFNNTIIYPNENLNNLENVITQRRCSFCRSSNHFITTCVDPRINQFGELCKDSRRLFQYRTNARQLFTEWCINYSVNNANVVRAFAINKCGCRSRSNWLIFTQAIVHWTFSQDLTISEYDEYESYDADADEAAYYAQLYNNWAETSPHNNFEPHCITVHCKSDGPFVPMCETECSICFENMDKNNVVKLNCNHDFCKQCVINIIIVSRTNNKIPNCALCRSDITTFTVNTNKLKEEILQQTNN